MRYELNTQEFLRAVVSSEKGYFLLAYGTGSVWLEEWHKWPDDIDEICKHAELRKHDSNVYFSSYVWRSPQSTKENVLPTRTIQADLDEADILTLPREPTVLVETSPGRHQAYWVLDQEVPLEEHEELSRRLTYSIPLCDRSGWPLGRKVRVANTFNHKYATGPKPVQVVRHTGAAHKPEDFEALPEVPAYTVAHYDEGFIENPVESSIHPRELLERLRTDAPSKVYIGYDVLQQDRSAALWSLMVWGFRVGLNRDEVYTLAKHSANNKFADLRHRSEQALAKDVLRAQHFINTNRADEKSVISDLYKNNMAVIDRKRAIFTVVLSSLKEQGDFHHSTLGNLWYIRRDVGRPIPVSITSEYLQTLMDIQYGLNSTEEYTRYTLHGLRAHCHSLPDVPTEASMSYYDQTANHLLLHTGKRNVLRISTSQIETLVDGAYQVIFPWVPTTQPFTPVMRKDNDIDWGDELFGNGTRGYGTSVDNVTNMTPAQAMALLKAWFLFVLFRSAANSRPVIAALGAPGAGKSFLFKKIYAILYGSNKAIASVTTMDDFDHATANDPLVVLDNVDTWQSWLPDRLALSAGVSDITARKKFTDQDIVVIRRRAILGVTAHNPKFGREDVADRFLLFSFKRLEDFASEGAILRDLLTNRNRIWGALVRDVQRVLSTPMPQDAIPQFRIEDFARLGLWIARAIGVENDFRSAIEDVKHAQQTFTLEEDGTLVGAILKYVARTQKPSPMTAAELWSVLEACSEDPHTFARLYRSSTALSKKLNAMQPALKELVNVDYRLNGSGMREWWIQKRTG